MTPPTQRTGNGDDGIDIVPGDPPVSLTVWRTLAGPDPDTRHDRARQQVVALRSMATALQFRISTDVSWI